MLGETDAQNPGHIVRTILVYTFHKGWSGGVQGMVRWGILSNQSSYRINSQPRQPAVFHIRPSVGIMTCSWAG